MAKSMRSRKLSHLSATRHAGILGLDNVNNLARSHAIVMRKERRAIKTMDEAFRAITNATGIESLEELVDTFVHADRRNYSVVKHITALERDVDEITVELRDLKERRKRLELEQQRSGLSRRQKVRLRVVSAQYACFCWVSVPLLPTHAASTRALHVSPFYMHTTSTGRRHVSRAGLAGAAD